MAKIGKRSSRILEKWFEYDIMYSKDNGFYIVIPSEYTDVFDSLTDEQKKDNHAHQIKGRGYSNILGNGVLGNSEKEVQNYFESLMRALVGITLVQKKVILVWYDKEEKSKSAYYSDERDEVGYTIRYAYANEVKNRGASKANYYRQDAGKNKLNIGYHEKVTVIEDKPENRKAIEELYNATILLTNKLDILTDPAKLQKAIDSRQKLLG